jgi:hypothetical protein
VPVSVLSSDAQRASHAAPGQPLDGLEPLNGDCGPMVSAVPAISVDTLYSPGMLEKVSAMRLRFLWVLFSIALVAVWAGCRAEETRKDILGTEIKRYSQWNEELIIRDFFQDERGGVFLDVGCAWPVRKSTTFYLEKHLGWSGIAIDALDIYRPGWAAVRPRSEFLAYAVTDHSGDKVTFYQHASAPVLSSLSKEQAALMGGEESLTTVEVETTTLNDVLDA